MNIQLEIFQPAAESNTPVAVAAGDAKFTLESYINACGLVAYKDFYMKIKSGLVTVPAPLTKAQYWKWPARYTKVARS
jgi:hypothetical protein